MSRLVTGSRVFWLLAVISFGSITNAQSQDIFQELDQVKKDLSGLKSEVRDLRNQFFSLRRTVLESKSPAPQQMVEKTQPKEAEPPKPENSLTDEQLTKIICRAIGTFFSETEAILQTADPLSADEGMREALRKLNASLRSYTGIHRVSKLLTIYEGLASDAYMAVELRRSVAGNEDFVRTLREHKQKYLKTCPRS